MASLGSGCTYLKSMECVNRNYLSDLNYINSWLLNSVSENTPKVLYLYTSIGKSFASSEKKINPVIYISAKTVVVNGKGNETKPYIVK